MDSSRFLQIVFAVFATYVIHSALLLGSAWLMDQRRWLKSHSLREQLWKWAAIAPLLTACIQVGWTSARPVWTYEVGVMSSPTEAVVADVSALANAVLSIDARHGDVDESLTYAAPAAETQLSAASPSTVELTPLSAAKNLAIADPPVADAVLAPPLSLATALTESTPGEITSTDTEWVVQITPGESSANVDFSFPVVTVPSEMFPPSAADENAHSPATGQQSQTAVPQSEYWTLVVVAAMGWSLLGMFVLLGKAILIARHLKSCRSMTDGRAWTLLNEIRRRHDVRRKVSLRSSPRVAEPSACGIFRWSILLPCDFETKLDDDELRVLLAHELGHLVRRDTVWLWAGRLLTSCLTFQPLNYLAVKRWQRQAAEFQCDDWAVQSVQNRVTLARVLASVAEWKSQGSFSPGVSASAPPLSQRIERLLSETQRDDPWTRGKRRWMLCAVVLASIGIGASYSPGLTLAEAPAFVDGGVTVENTSKSASSAEDTIISEQMPLLNNDLRRLTVDLKVALTLLKQQEQNQEVVQQADVILQRLQQIRMSAPGDK